VIAELDQQGSSKYEKINDAAGLLINAWDCAKETCTMGCTLVGRALMRAFTPQMRQLMGMTASHITVVQHGFRQADFMDVQELIQS